MSFRQLRRALLLQLLLLAPEDALALGQEATECAGSAEACAGPQSEDLTDLLQREVRRASMQRDAQQRAQSKDASSIWAAFEGGGFLAMNGYAGIVAGLLATKPGSTLGGEDGLFSRVENMASTSGGSWFVGLLSYSEKYLDLIHQTAKSPGNKDLWYNQMFWPFLKSMGDLNKPTWIDKLIFRANSKLQSVIEAIIEAYVTLHWVIGDWPVHWEDYVKRIYISGGIDPTTTLGNQPNAWAEGKAWSAVTSVSSLGGSGTGTCTTCPTSNFCQDGNGESDKIGVNAKGTQFSNYKAVPGKGLNSSMIPNFLPAAVSYRIGSGAEAKAVHPFVTPRFDTLSFSYENKLEGGLPTKVKGNPVGSWPGFTDYTGKLPLVSVAASSSACFGGEFSMTGEAPVYAAELVDYIFKINTDVHSDNPIVDLADGVEDLARTDVRDILIKSMTELLRNDFNWQWSVWAAQEGKEGQAYALGDQWWTAVQDANGALKTPEFKKMAGDGLISLADGGYTDGTGVATAIAHGATEVTAFLDFEGGILALFHYNTTSPDADSSSTPCPGIPSTFQVFAEAGKEVQAQFLAEATSLKLSTDDTVLDAIRIWSTTATTVDSPAYGIAAGRRIQLNFISIESTVPIAFDYLGQSALLSQVASTVALPENSAAAATMWQWLAK